MYIFEYNDKLKFVEPLRRIYDHEMAGRDARNYHRI
jgi:hypothetical protein